MFSKLIPAAAAVLAFACAGGVHAADVVRTAASPTAAISQTVTVPPGYTTIYLSGILPDVPKAPEPPGDAETQATSVFTKIGTVLKSKGLTEADVVSMTIYMATPDGSKMDFPGMMKAYTKFYGTPEQPNKPSRSTVQVVALAAPGALLEVEVTAVQKPK